MFTVAVPYHLDERVDAFDAGPVDLEVGVPLPPGEGPWQRMAVLYERVAQVVADRPVPVLVISTDCTTSLGVLAGLQRAGHDPGVVWLDAHADFHTEATTTSGYLGGLPLALAVGIGTPTLPALLGLRAVPQDRAVLVDARDTDPPESALLAGSAVARTTVADLEGDTLPAGPLYLHLDLDVCDPDDVPDLLYPVPGGPALTEVLGAVGRVLDTGRVVGIGLAATWRHGSPAASRHWDVLRQLRKAVG